MDNNAETREEVLAHYTLRQILGNVIGILTYAAVEEGSVILGDHYHMSTLARTAAKVMLPIVATLFARKITNEVIDAVDEYDEEYQRAHHSSYWKDMLQGLHKRVQPLRTKIKNKFQVLGKKLPRKLTPRSVRVTPEAL